MNSHLPEYIIDEISSLTGMKHIDDPDVYNEGYNDGEEDDEDAGTQLRYRGFGKGDYWCASGGLSLPKEGKEGFPKILRGEEYKTIVTNEESENYDKFGCDDCRKYFDEVFIFKKEGKRLQLCKECFEEKSKGEKYEK